MRKSIGKAVANGKTSRNVGAYGGKKAPQPSLQTGKTSRNVGAYKSGTMKGRSGKSSKM